MSLSNNRLFFEFYFITQADIELALAKYSRLRDCYWTYPINRRLNDMSMPLIILANILAVATNKSLTAYLPLSSYQYSLNPTELQNPVIFPLVQSLDMPYRRVNHLWSLYYKSNLRSKFTPKFLQVSTVVSNFVYCQVPKREQIDVANFRDFTSTFDKYSWLGILLSGFGVTLVLGVKNWHICLSTLLTDGVVYLRRTLRHSAVFLLWMLSSLFLRHLYSARITSILINPPEDVTLPNISSLKQENYTLLFGGTTELIGSQTTYASIPFVGLSVSLKLLKDMIAKATYVNGPFEHMKALQMNGIKYATAMEWTFVIQIAELLNAHQFVSTNKRCYVGKELIQLGYCYFAFLPPESDKLANLFQRLVEIGVFQRWHSEYLAMSHSRRVQDRVRVKGPTKVLQNFEAYHSLSIQGKLLKVFVLWGLCLVICVCILSLENVFKRYKRILFDKLEFRFIFFIKRLRVCQRKGRCFTNKPEEVYIERQNSWV